MTEFRRVRLTTGVTLNVALAGPDDAPAVILLHGFPESHRTWRGIAPLLEDRFRLIMPDLRGFAGSDRPQEVEAYRTSVIVEDVLALADALSIENFALVGHDWGGAVAWSAAIQGSAAIAGNPRIERLAIVNSPHPVIFQKSLIDSTEQRAASQYMNAFRAPGMDKAIEAMGFEAFFEKTFSAHVDLALIAEAEKQQYIAEWSQPGAMAAMLNWYRASPLIVPPPLLAVPVPDWVLGAFPKVRVPTLVVWGMRDHALLPLQLDGLDRLVDDLSIVRLPDAGHFAPWETPELVAEALGHFLGGQAAATAPA
ncbi:MAG: alpha/beta fold hydrolase [Sphingomonas sp.]|nr:alpha/beta fold hydrolase [Sphingomonas sp.]